MTEERTFPERVKIVLTDFNGRDVILSPYKPLLPEAQFLAGLFDQRRGEGLLGKACLMDELVTINNAFREREFRGCSWPGSMSSFLEVGRHGHLPRLFQAWLKGFFAFPNLKNRFICPQFDLERRPFSYQAPWQGGYPVLSRLTDLMVSQTETALEKLGQGEASDSIRASTYREFRRPFDGWDGLLRDLFQGQVNVYNQTSRDEFQMITDGVTAWERGLLGTEAECRFFSTEGKRISFPRPESWPSSRQIAWIGKAWGREVDCQVEVKTPAVMEGFLYEIESDLFPSLVMVTDGSYQIGCLASQHITYQNRQTENWRLLFTVDAGQTQILRIDFKNYQNRNELFCQTSSATKDRLSSGGEPYGRWLGDARPELIFVPLVEGNFAPFKLFGARDQSGIMKVVETFGK
ncbi:hypothetical protein ACFLZP_03260 [Patescibacteria group bacterium]